MTSSDSSVSSIDAAIMTRVVASMDANADVVHDDDNGAKARRFNTSVFSTDERSTSHDDDDDDNDDESEDEPPPPMSLPPSQKQDSDANSDSDEESSSILQDLPLPSVPGAVPIVLVDKSKEPQKKKSKLWSARKTKGAADDDNNNAENDKKDEKKLPPVSFTQLYRYCTALERFALVVSYLSAIAVGASQPLFMLIFGNSITAFGSGGPVGSSLYLNFVYLGVGTAVAGFLNSLLNSWVSSRLSDRVRLLYVRALLRQEIGWYDSQSTGAVVARVSGDVDLVQEGLNRAPMIFQSLSTFVGGFVVGFIASWKLSIVIVGCAPLLMCVGAFIGRLMATMAREGQAAFGDSIAVAQEALSGVRLVMAFCGERIERNLYDRSVDKGVADTTRRQKFNGIGIGIALLVMQLVQALALWYGSQLLSDGSVADPGSVFTAFFSVLVAAMSLGLMGEPMASLATARGVAAALYDVIQRPSTIDATRDEAALASTAQLAGRIEFRDVRFAYPTRPDVEVLKGLSFVVKPGHSLALIGSSGCGKSTSVALIERFYEPTAGEILIDDKPIQSYGIGALRNRIALVSQEPVLFARSIRDNIKLGAIEGTTPTDEDMMRAAKRANAHDFIMSLPQGYDTMVGERSAAKLSGGQKQRVAIARALIRNPVVLLLDESTSALDAASESVVQQALDEISRELTTITIAHRLSTIKDANEIIYLEKGVVVERGTHKELLRAKGKYAAQHAAQSKAEREVSHRTTSERQKEADQVMLATDEGEGAASAGGALEAGAAAEDAELTMTTWAAVRQMYRWCRPHIGDLFLGSVFGLLGGIVDPLGALFQVSVMFAMFQLLVPSMQAEGQAAVNQWVLVFVGLAVARSLFMVGRVVGLGRVSSKVVGLIRKSLFGAMLAQEPGWFDRSENRVGALTNKLSADANAVQTNITQVWPSVLTLISVIFAALVIAFVHCVKLAAVLMFTMPVVMLGGLVRMRALTGDSKKLRKTYERGGMLASEAVGQIRTVASLHRELTFGDEYRDELTVAERTLLRSAVYGAVAFGMTQFASFGTWALAFWYGNILVQNGECTPVGMFTSVMVIIFSSQQLGHALTFLGDIDKAVDSCSSIVAILRRRSKIDARRHAPDAVRDVELSVEASMRKVHFAYPTRLDQPVLRGVDFVTPPGQTLAIVGPSGSGKSSIIALFQRLYDADRGQVLLDQREIREYDLSFVRSKLAIVQQEPILFNRSIRDNISYGMPGATQEEIETAAKLANAHDFIVAMPAGYDTKAGEGGSALSGGQRQRIAIARAVIRQPRLLLLDEATSALDNESQALVQQALESARKRSTTIIVAHRLSTIQAADQIVVVERGQVVERGTHAELLEKRGAYYELMHHQLLVEGQS